MKEKEIRDLKIKLMESRKKYMTEAMEFRKKILKEKSVSELRKKKELW